MKPSASSLVFLLFLAFPCMASTQSGPTKSTLERGRYMAIVGGCNDCHTEGFAERGGKVTEKHWLEGSVLGWHGPWGTTYAPNLRHFMQTMTVKQWINFAKTQKLMPPMPYWALRNMKDKDLAALYHFIRHLGPSNKVVPQYVPPGQMPAAPYVKWVLPAKGQ